MPTEYKVLKKYGDFKKGDLIDITELELSAEDVQEAIDGGFIALIEEKAKKTKATTATVTWNGGVREFSEKVHGEDFMSLAESFATKFNGTIA